MRRGTHIRLTVLELPANVTAAHLLLLAVVARPLGIHEGFLADDIRVCEMIRLKRNRRHSQFSFISTVVTRIEPGFALTEGNYLCQLVRVPVSISSDYEM